MKGKRILLIVPLILILIFVFSFCMISQKNQRVFEEKIESKINNKTIAIMLETEYQSGEYITSSSNSFPENMKFNENLSKCENGGDLIWNENNRTVVITTAFSEKCYLYFDNYQPVELSLANNTFSWEPIEDAQSYNIYVDDVLVTNVSSPDIELYKYLPRGGNYKLKVAAVDELNHEISSDEYDNYIVSQVSPTIKTRVQDSNDVPEDPPEYSEYVLPEFDYINVINFSRLTTSYQTEAQDYCNNYNGNGRCICWQDWLFDTYDFYSNYISNNFCSLNPNLCDTYSNVTSSPFSVSIFHDNLSFSIQNESDVITINTNEHKLYYTSLGYSYQIFLVQFGKYGYVPSEWVLFNPTWICVDENSIVYIYDKKKKRFKKKKIKRVKYTDELLVWDFDNGCFSIAKPLWIKQKETTYQYNLLRFSDGSTLKTINHHRIFNVEKGRFTYPMTSDTPIGTTTFNSKGEYVKLISSEVVYKKINYCNIITNYHMNCFVSNILTSSRLNNIYEIKKMKFVKDNRKLKSYEDFKGIDKKWYDGLRLSEYDGNINKDGSYRKDLKDYIERLEKIAKKK